MIQKCDWNSNLNHFERRKRVKSQFHDNLSNSVREQKSLNEKSTTNRLLLQWKFPDLK